MGRRPSPKTQLELIDAEIRAARKRPRTTSAAIAKLLKLRQAELDRLAALRVNPEAITGENRPAKQTESEQVTNPGCDVSLLSDLIRSESEPEPVRIVNAAREPDSLLSEVDDLADKPEKSLTREKAMLLISARTSLESQQNNRFQLVDRKGVPFGSVMTWRCTPDHDSSGKRIHHLEASTKDHLKFINPETGHWVDFDGRDVPSNAELARRQRIRDEHLARFDREQRERESDKPVVKIPRCGTYNVAAIWGPRSNYGLPELEHPQPNGELDYGSPRLTREQESNQEVLRQVEADRSARNTNPWQREGF